MALPYELEKILLEESEGISVTYIPYRDNYQVKYRKYTSFWTTEEIERNSEVLLSWFKLVKRGNITTLEQATDMLAELNRRSFKYVVTGTFSKHGKPYTWKSKEDFPIGTVVKIAGYVSPVRVGAIQKVHKSTSVEGYKEFIPVME